MTDYRPRDTSPTRTSCSTTTASSTRPTVSGCALTWRGAPTASTPTATCGRRCGSWTWRRCPSRPRASSARCGRGSSRTCASSPPCGRRGRSGLARRLRAGGRAVAASGLGRRRRRGHRARVLRRPRGTRRRRRIAGSARPAAFHGGARARARRRGRGSLRAVAARPHRAREPDIGSSRSRWRAIGSGRRISWQPGRVYRRTADALGETATSELLEDLERVLLDVANGSAEPTPREIESWRRAHRPAGPGVQAACRGRRVAAPAGDGHPDVLTGGARAPRRRRTMKTHDTIRSTHIRR